MAEVALKGSAPTPLSPGANMNPEAQPDVSPGQRLYRLWCESETSDRAHYWTRMNRADKASWEQLAKLLDRVETSWRNLSERKRQEIQDLHAEIRRLRLAYDGEETANRRAEADLQARIEQLKGEADQTQLTHDAERITQLEDAIRKHRSRIRARGTMPFQADFDLWSTVQPATERSTLGMIAVLLEGQEGANVTKARQVALRALDEKPEACGRVLFGQSGDACVLHVGHDGPCSAAR